MGFENHCTKHGVRSEDEMSEKTKVLLDRIEQLYDAPIGLGDGPRQMALLYLPTRARRWLGGSARKLNQGNSVVSSAKVDKEAGKLDPKRTKCLLGA